MEEITKKEDRIKNYVNSRYDRIVKQNDEKVILEVLEAIKEPAYGYVWKTYKNCPPIMEDKKELADDIVYDGLALIYEKSLFGFEGKVTSSDGFYAHLMDYFKYVMYKYVPRDRKEDIEKGKSKLTFVESIQAREERLNQNEKSSNDHTLKELKDSSWDPLSRVIDEEEKLLAQRKGDIADEVMMNTSVIPHEMISYCYAVVLPRSLASAVFNNGEYVEALYISLENALSEDDSALGAEIFLKTFNRLSREIGMPYDITDMDITFKLHPFLQGIINRLKKEQPSQAKKIRAIRDIVDKANGSRVKSIGKKKIQAKFAKKFMKRDNISTMSEKFAAAYNREQDRHFTWGETYKGNLKKGYHKYNYEIDVEGDVVYSEYFSKPFGEDTKSSDRDYLGENIRKNAERAEKQYKKDFERKWHEVSDDGMRDTFLHLYSKKKVEEMMNFER